VNIIMVKKRRLLKSLLITSIFLTTLFLTSITRSPTHHKIISALTAFDEFTQPGGDGDDIAVKDWINLLELEDKNDFYSIGSDAVLVVIDSGFGTVPWNKIEEELGEWAAKSITYWVVRQHPNKNYSCHFIYDNKSEVDTHTYQSPSGEWAYVNDYTGHGTSIVYLIKRLFPNIRLLVIGVRSDIRFGNIWLYLNDIKRALDLLNQKKIYYVQYSLYGPGIEKIIRPGDEKFILSLSFGDEQYDEQLEKKTVEAI